MERIDSLAHDEGSRESVITEKEFLTSLGPEATAFFEQAAGLGIRPNQRFSKEQCALLMNEAERLETFLDDVDARNNRRFSTLTELIASIRGFSTVGNVLHHIKVRLPRYKVRAKHSEVVEFQKSVFQAQEFVETSLAKLLMETRTEVRRLGIEVKDTPARARSSMDDAPRRHPPHNIDCEDDSSDEARVASVLSRFLEVRALLQMLDQYKPIPTEGEGLLRFVANHYNESKARAFESRVHNLQAAYDTDVRFRAIEQDNPLLRSFRGHVSLALHLLEVATLLIHFYERHDRTSRHKTAFEMIRRLVHGDEVLRHAIHLALARAVWVLDRTQPIVEELLPRFVRQKEITLEIPGDGVLHARPLSLIVNVVKHHGTAVEMIINDEACAASSIMSLIVFASKYPDERRIRFRGDQRPLQDLQLLFESGLGENGMDKLPEPLNYLKSRKPGPPDRRS